MRHARPHVDFVVAKYRGRHIVLFRAFRDERATAAKRRKKVTP